MQPNESANEIFVAVKDYISRSLRGVIVQLRGVIVRLTEMEKRLASVKDGKDGADGLQGLSGKDGAIGKDGADGKDGINGKDGVPGKDGTDGKDVDAEEIRRLVLEEVAKAVAELPPPKQGEPGQDGRDGKQGPPGRDAAQLEFVRLDRTRSYPRGTCAKYGGGILQAVRTTGPFEGDAFEEAGWEALWVGAKAIHIERLGEDGRDYVFKTILTAGEPTQMEAHIPVQVYKGVWKEGNEYRHGDTVTLGGSTWHANRDTLAKPGISNDWTLMVKRGSDGRDAVNHKVVSMQ